MTSIDPKTMKKSGFWLEKCEFLNICACQSGLLWVSSKLLILGARSCLYFASNCDKKWTFWRFYLAHGGPESETRVHGSC